MSQRINVESMLGMENGPQVSLAWGNEEGLLTAEEARAHALSILEAAEAAEQDEFIYSFAVEQIGCTQEEAVNMLRAFRQFRQEKQKGERKWKKT